MEKQQVSIDTNNMKSIYTEFKNVMKSTHISN